MLGAEEGSIRHANQGYVSSKFPALGVGRGVSLSSLNVIWSQTSDQVPSLWFTLLRQAAELQSFIRRI